MQILKAALQIFCAYYFKLTTFGRVEGSRFLIRSPILVRAKVGSRVRIGDGTHIEPLLRLVAEGDIEIGENVYIGKNATIVAFSKLSIGARTLIGENVSIHTENHGGQGRRMEYSTSPITIGADVWIGAGVVVTAGVTIGDGVTIGANSVVTKSFGDGVTVAGVPAKIIGSN